MPLASLAQSAAQTPDELTMAQLGAQMTALAQAPARTTRAVAFNYYSKLSLPFICLAFALCAPPLALRFARAGAYIGHLPVHRHGLGRLEHAAADQVPGHLGQNAALPGRLVPGPAVRHAGRLLFVAGGVGLGGTHLRTHPVSPEKNPSRIATGSAPFPVREGPQRKKRPRTDHSLTPLPIAPP